MALKRKIMEQVAAKQKLENLLKTFGVEGDLKVTTPSNSIETNFHIENLQELIDFGFALVAEMD